jgi:hypothetical protein
LEYERAYARSYSKSGPFHGKAWRTFLLNRLDGILSVYNFSMLPDLQLNDVVRMRKAHPCGSYEWKVTRLGADIGLECKGCGRRVMLTRRELARRVKTIQPRQENEPHEPE